MDTLFIYLVNMVTAIPSSIMPAILVCRTVQIRKPKQYVLICTLQQLTLWSVNNFVLSKPLSAVDFIITILLFVLTWIYAHKGQRIAAVLSMIVYVSAVILATYMLMFIAFPAADFLGIPREYLADSRSWGYAFMAAVASCFTGLAMYLSHLILKKYLSRLHFPRKLLLFLPVPLSQATLVNIILRLMPFSSQIASINRVLLLGILFCIVADVCFFFGIRKIVQSNQLEMQIRLTEEHLNTQVSYYRQIQENILKVNQIRHDLNNQLQAAYYLLDQGEKDQVRCQLDQLQDNLRNKVGPQFCANLMVDAVLADKARLCREKGIRLDVNANLPAELPIENTHLCSAFSNLLDNSIQGTLESSAKEKAIELRAALHSDYLVIYCSNPALQPIAKKKEQNILRPHGLGLDILKQIANEYGGELDIVHNNNRFEVSLMLRFRNV